MLAGIALAVAAFAFTRLPRLSPSERSRLAQTYQFERLPMPGLKGTPFRMVRGVAPSLARINAWMSSLGAGVAMADLDGDGLANDLCHVEPRTDEVIVAPAPGGTRYAQFVLRASPLPYDESNMAPMGCMAGDLNEDGLVDLAVYYWGRTPVAFLRRTGAPGRAEVLRMALFKPVEIAPTGERWFTNAMLFADADGDGHLDVLAGNYFQDGARILDTKAPGVEVLHDTKSKSYNGGRKHLLLWKSASPAPEPSISFTEASGVFDEQVARGWTLAAGAADLDGDLLPEIYLANDFGPDRLLHNRSKRGLPRFVVVEGRKDLYTPASCVLGKDSFKGMGVDFGDVNGDGVPDIYVSNIADEFALQESHFLWLSTGGPEHAMSALTRGEAPYAHGSEKLGLSRGGWGWDCRLADFDNDGVLEAVQATGFVKGSINRWPELQALGTGNDGLMHDPGFWPGFRPGDDLSGHNYTAFFARKDGGRFHNIGLDVGLNQPAVSRGIAIGDLNGDGHLDFALANQYEDSFVYLNKGAGNRAFLGLHLLMASGASEIRVRPGHPGEDMHGGPAIGAQAVVHLAGGRVLAGEVDGGSGHSGKRSHDLHFGLANEKGPVPVELRWRDRTGRRKSIRLELPLGWHTVVFGSGAGGQP